jgi:RNA polymerase sigma-70 factor (ECF subfamily)
VSQIIELDALEPNAKRDNRNGSVRSDPPKSGLVEQSSQKEILAFVPRLTRYARTLTRDNVAADDLVQDCLTTALRKIHLWEPGTDLRAWLFTILHNQHINRLRRDARHRASINLQKSYQTVTLLPDQNMRLELRDVERALAQLPEEQRSLIVGIGLEGMRYEDAASEFNVPLGTVRSRVARGREMLRSLTGRLPAHDDRAPDGSHRPAAPRRAAANRHSVQPSPTRLFEGKRIQEVCDESLVSSDLRDRHIGVPCKHSRRRAAARDRAPVASARR